MSNASPTPETVLNIGGMDSARIETLGDGIFAIVITLLVFDLKVPVVPTGVDPSGALPGLILAMWPKFVSWVLSFLIIGVYWQAHHGQYHMIRRVDRPLIWLNILFFAMVCLIPFSASLLGAYPFAPIAAVVYGSNLVLVNMSLALHWRHATRNCFLVDANLPAATVEVGFRRILLPPVVYSIAMGLAAFDTRASVLLFGLMPLAYVLPTPVDRFFSAPYRRAGMTGRGLHPAVEAPASGEAGASVGDGVG